MPALTIHFVCTGNVYRSRLAEAYCASRHGHGIQVLSSGIRAGVESDAPISPYAADTLRKHGLASFAAPYWQRTTAGLVRASNVLVFMESEHLRFCGNWIEPARQTIAVWEIEDIGPIATETIPDEVARTFSRICRHTDALLTTLGMPTPTTTS